MARRAWRLPPAEDGTRDFEDRRHGGHLAWALLPRVASRLIIDQNFDSTRLRAQPVEMKHLLIIRSSTTAVSAALRTPAIIQTMAILIEFFPKITRSTRNSGEEP